MSLKPLKKSDLGKDWVRNDRYVRKVGIQMRRLFMPA